jgi:hypothetical protein
MDEYREGITYMEEEARRDLRIIFVDKLCYLQAGVQG